MISEDHEDVALGELTRHIPLRCLVRGAVSSHQIEVHYFLLFFGHWREPHATK